MPRLRSKMFQLVPDLGETMTHLMHPKSNVHPIFVANVFEKQEKSLRIMGNIEKQMLSSRTAQFFNTSMVKKIE